MDENSSQDLVSDFKSFHLHTHLGLGLCILFLICCFIVTIAIKWFLMVPFAIGSGYLLYSRKDHSTGLEKDVCTYGFWGITALFIIRDINMSSKLAELVNAAQQLQGFFK